MAGVTSSFDVAEVALRVVGELSVSDRQINKLVTELGGQMAADRDARPQAYVEQPLPPGEEVPEGDPRKIAHAALTYFTNNRSRMDYPGYRREGLPVTGSPAESLVKPIKRRVKGAEKFWNDGPSGEAILQLRAAVLRGCPETNLSAANDLRQVTRGLGWLRRGEVAENPPC